MKVRAHAALSAKGKLEPFEYEPGPLGPHQVDVRVTH
jgi:alcohol/geraniol dehydrogenase (NADP+)